jgi:hypothetical protein
MKAEGLQAIAQLQGGTFGATIAEQFNTMMKVSRETGKKAALVITISTDAVGQMNKVLGESVLKLPKAKLEADMFFVTEEGAITTENPKQRSLELRAVEPPRSEVRERDDDETPRLRGAAGQ